MQLTSPSFSDNGFIPEIFSFEDGDGINPELVITDVPDRTKSMVLVMDDIDAPGGSFIHWLVFDIPPTRTDIEQDSIPGKQARSSAKRRNYAGPRPPAGTHRYVFTVYALDKVLPFDEGVDKGIVLEAMQGHILDWASLSGKYSKKVAAAV